MLSPVILDGHDFDILTNLFPVKSGSIYKHLRILQTSMDVQQQRRSSIFGHLFTVLPFHVLQQEYPNGNTTMVKWRRQSSLRGHGGEQPSKPAFSKNEKSARSLAPAAQVIFQPLAACWTRRLHFGISLHDYLNRRSGRRTHLVCQTGCCRTRYHLDGEVNLVLLVGFHFRSSCKSASWKYLFAPSCQFLSSQPG